MLLPLASLLTIGLVGCGKTTTPASTETATTEGTSATTATATATATSTETATATTTATETSTATSTTTETTVSSSEDVTKGTIAAITASGDYDVKGVVAAVTTKGFVLDDGTGAIFVYVALDAAYKQGDYVAANITVAPYFAIWEATKVNSIAKATGTAPTLKTATALTAAIVADWVSKPGSKTETEAALATKDVYPVTFTAAADLDGTYAFFTLDGSTTKLEPSGLDASVEVLKGVKYEVVAYCGGYNSSKSYVSLYVQSIAPKYDALTALTITGETTVSVNAKVQLSAAATPAGADPHVTWSTSNDKVATVDANGAVTGVAEGSVTITAKSVADPTITKDFAMTVVKAVTTTSIVKYDLTKIADAPTTSPYGALDAAGMLAIFKDTTYVASGTNPITAVTTATAAYQGSTAQGPKIRGLKLGASSTAGVLTFTSSASVAEVKVTVRAWSSSKLATVTIGDATAVALVAADATADRTIDVKITAGTSVTINTSKYCVFTSLELIGA